MRAALQSKNVVYPGVGVAGVVMAVAKHLVSGVQSEPDAVHDIALKDQFTAAREIFVRGELAVRPAADYRRIGLRLKIRCYGRKCNERNDGYAGNDTALCQGS